jgi:hypothetical protein
MQESERLAQGGDAAVDRRRQSMEVKKSDFSSV